MQSYISISNLYIYLYHLSIYLCTYVYLHIPISICSLYTNKCVYMNGEYGMLYI